MSAKLALLFDFVIIANVMVSPFLTVFPFGLARSFLLLLLIFSKNQSSLIFISSH